MTHKKVNSDEMYCVESAKCSLLRVTIFSCSMDILHGGLGINILQLVITVKF
jgi:hypothetical protein